MTKNDIHVFHKLPRSTWLHIIQLLHNLNLYPHTIIPKYAQSRQMVESFNLYYITMADILHALTLSSRTSLKSVQILRQIYTTLLPTIPASISPLLNYGTISAVYPEFLQHPNPAYQVGASIADLHLILGIPLSVINRDISRGAIVLYSAPIQEYPTSTEEDEDVNS